MRERSINAKKRLKQEFFCIPNRTDISERPKIVEEKVRVGDWEGDTVISHGSHCALLPLVDRHSKYTIIRKVGHKTSENLSAAVIKSLKKERLPVRTITFDNGSEFAGHQRILKKLKTNIYFAKPYKSNDRGLNEHTNGLNSTVPSEKIRF